MTITTKSGKTFECDLAIESTTMPLLYLNITDSTVKKVSDAFTSEDKELPLAEYPAYTKFSFMSVSPAGVKVTLMKGEQ